MGSSFIFFSWLVIIYLKWIVSGKEICFYSIILAKKNLSGGIVCISVWWDYHMPAVNDSLRAINSLRFNDDCSVAVIGWNVFRMYDAIEP